MLYGRYLMNCLHNDSFNDLSNAYANLGDSIQSIAIDSIYKQLGISKTSIRYIKRDFPNQYNEESVDLIFYSEFVKINIRNRINFSKKINIKGIISAVFYDNYQTLNDFCPSLSKIIKEEVPIGARDEESCEMLKRNGFEAYLTGCFTICFQKREFLPTKTKVFFVDTPKELENFIPKNIRKNSEYLSHSVKINKYPVDEQENLRLEKKAYEILHRYIKEATLVVTSRLHVAIPCIAIGVPVILAVNNLDFRFGWIEKLIKPYQIGEYKNINWNPVPIDVEPLKKVMLQLFENALNSCDYRKELMWLDDFYSNRNRVKPYKAFREIIFGIKSKIDNIKPFNYLIWGAGFHCRYAFKLISEIIPNSHLIAVVDKFQTGSFENVRIIKETQIDSLKVDYMFITTAAGEKDAITWRNTIKPTLPYSLLISQQKS